VNFLMIFHRSIAVRRYQNHTAYRSLLRRDFQYRCAYCLTHEFYLGDEAGCCIDHHRPIKGRYASPDVINRPLARVQQTKCLRTGLVLPCRASHSIGRGDFVRRTSVFEAGKFLYPTLARGLMSRPISIGAVENTTNTKEIFGHHPKKSKRGNASLIHDPCQPEGDHDLHWDTLIDGRLEPKTLEGEYTVENLKL